MKKVLVSFLLLVLSASAFSQQINSPQKLSGENYFKKSKKQKTIAWVMLGGGIPFTLLGFHLKQYVGIGAGMAGIGVLSVLGSFPLFIASSRNKKKGMELSLKNELTPKLQQGSFVNQGVPSLSLKINL